MKTLVLLLTFTFLGLSCSGISNKKFPFKRSPSSIKSKSPSEKYKEHISSIQLDYKELERIKSWARVNQFAPQIVNSWSNFYQIVQDLKISAQNFDLDEMKQAQKFESYIQEITPFYSHLNIDIKRKLDLHLGIALNQLESFHEVDFTFDTYVPLTGVVSISASGISLIENSYEERVLKEQLNKLREKPVSVSEFERRSFEAKNTLLLNDFAHDIKHIKFFKRNPMAMVAFHMSARSKNHLRYVMMKSLNEGVDSLMYHPEKMLYEYMTKKLKLSLADSMIYIFKASQSQLDHILSYMGIEQALYDDASDYRQWMPPVLDHFSRQELDENLLDAYFK